MELVSFTIEFFEHVKNATRKHSLDLLRNKGASVEQIGDHAFKVSCPVPRVGAFAARFLSSPAMGRSCRVISTSDGAQE